MKEYADRFRESHGIFHKTSLIYLLSSAILSLYLVLCVIFEEPENCAARPSFMTEVYLYFIELPFLTLNLLAYLFCKGPKCLMMRSFGLWLPANLLASIWEFLAIYELLKLNDCQFNLASFNLVFLCVLNFKAVISMITLPVAYFYVRKIAQKESNKRN